MSIYLLTVALVMPVIVILGFMGYLRPILRKVLTEICGTLERAEFWIRCATLLSLFGALILVLTFGFFGDEKDVIGTLRWILILTLGGGFVGIAWISRTVWNSMVACPGTRERLGLADSSASAGKPA